jgi:SAM-dependent methyltransferase
MYSKIRKFLRENRDKPIVSFFYRHLKIYEKRRLLKACPPEVIVNIKATEEIYHKDVERLQMVNDYIQGETLDVGSKYGLVTKGKDVVAFDIVKDYLRLNVHNNKVLGDACNLPFVDKGFTTVVATEILEHLEHPEIAIKEIRRVLKKPGRAVITVPNRYNFFSENTHLHYFTERKVCHLFKDFEVMVCKAISTGHIFGVFKAIE